MSILKGEFTKNPTSGRLLRVKTVEETRREKLQSLIRQHGGTAALVERIAVPEINASRLSRIANANVRHDRGGAVYVMGSEVARQIEESLGLETGWMDTPLTYAEIHGAEDPRATLMLAMESMTVSQLYTAAALIQALKQTQPDATAQPGQSQRTN